MHVQVAFPSVLCSRRGVAPAHAHLSHSAFPLCISSGFQETRIIYCIFQHLFFSLLGSETPLVQTVSKQAGTAHTHESLCRRSYSSAPDGCAVHAVLILRVLLVPDVYTRQHTQQCALYLLMIWVFYTSRRHRARAYVITNIYILCTT